MCLDITDKSLLSQTSNLQLAIHYEMNDISGCQKVLEDGNASAYGMLVNKGCMLFKEMRFKEAIDCWMKANSHADAPIGRSDLNYNLALGYYMLKDYVKSLDFLADVIERGLAAHPEFEGESSPGAALKAFPNSQSLHESRLVESYNLRAAIEYQLENLDIANDAMAEMPYRLEEDLDAVTLHNKAVLEARHDPAQSFDKLSHLLGIDSPPPSTIVNSLLLCIENDLIDTAADFLAQIDAGSIDDSDPFVGEFIRTFLQSIHTPDEAMPRFQQLANGI
eukprot:Partr_v1_DN27517_c1_g1_i2_m30850 putative Plays a role in anterograde intraflagellar transport (IFT), the process by which cilia precursors are transported from the base of the cilium to the site of their incorporation at the tip